MPSSETSNPYDTLVAAMPPAEEPSAAVALAPLGIALAIVLIAGAVIWRMRDKLKPGPATKKVSGVLLGLLTVVWFLWFTGALDNDQAKSYAIALPLAAIALRAAWKLARP